MDLVAPRPRTNSPRPIRILVVDDEQDARQLTVDVLANSGCAVEAVKDGAAGWDALQAGRYDLIVTDNKMPGMSGVEMIEQLRTARMALPVVMVTGYLPTHEYIRRPWLKPDVILEKPFSNADLLSTVKKSCTRTTVGTARQHDGCRNISHAHNPVKGLSHRPGAGGGRSCVSPSAPDDLSDTSPGRSSLTALAAGHGARH